MTNQMVQKRLRLIFTFSSVLVATIDLQTFFLVVVDLFFFIVIFVVVLKRIQTHDFKK